MAVDIPSLPVGAAADELLKAAPVYGPIIVVCIAAIVALSIYIVRLQMKFDSRMDAKDKAHDAEIDKLNAAFQAEQAEHKADLKAVIPFLQELRSSLLEAIINRGAGRRT